MAAFGVGVRAGDEVFAGGVGVAEAGVVAVEAAVEAAVAGGVERLALEVVVLMWRKSGYCIGSSPWRGTSPPGGTLLKAE